MNSRPSLLIITLCLIIFISACNETNNPKLKLSHLKLTFDSVAVNSSKSAQISIYNVGNSDLLINVPS